MALKLELDLEQSKGWAPLVRALQAQAEKQKIELIQIKEKFGQLRVYAHPTDPPNPEISDLTYYEFTALITACELISAHLCEWCGAPGTQNSGPRKRWIKTLCPQCIEKRAALEA